MIVSELSVWLVVKVSVPAPLAKAHVCAALKVTGCKISYVATLPCVSPPPPSVSVRAASVRRLKLAAPLKASETTA